METFIKKVKMNPCLWDHATFDYRDTAKKDRVWEAVAQECNIEDGQNAKMLWKRLRDSHREAIRRRRMAGGRFLKPWKYELEMEFILPERADPDPLLQEQDAGEQYVDVSYISDDAPVAAETDYHAGGAGHLTLRNMELHMQQNQQADEPKAKKSKLALSCTNNTDPLLDLFSSLYKKTSRLPTALKLKVQREMFNCVVLAEEEAHAVAAGDSCELLGHGHGHGHELARIKTTRDDDDNDE